MARYASASVVILTFTSSATPVAAQSFLNGDWVGTFHEDQPERGPGPELGDYLGIPINAAGRQYADSWDASRLTLPEHQCRAHVSPYIYRGPIRVRITEEIDPGTQTIIAIKHFLSTYAQERTIWLDGRPHPPEEAPHTWMGFSTGEWQGRVLKVRTTHIKQGWHRRNGIPMSAKATMTEYFFRHDNVLTQVSITEDPVFLEEPLVKTTNLAARHRRRRRTSIRRGCSVRPTTKFLAAIRRTSRTTCQARIRISPSSRRCTACPSRRRAAAPRRCIRSTCDKIKTMPVPALAGTPVRPSMFKQLLIVAAAVAAGRAFSAVSTAARKASAAVSLAAKAVSYTMPVQGNVHVIVGAGSNVTVQVGSLGAILVDTGTAQNADAVLASLAPADEQAGSPHHQHALARGSRRRKRADRWRRARRSPGAASPSSAPAPARAPRSSRTKRR